MDMREVLEAMRINGLHDEATEVGVVMKQRAELLEALKNAQALYPCTMYAEAITLAEAAE